MKTVLQLPISAIDVPDFVERPENRVADDVLRKSIIAGGIQQPLVVVAGPVGKILAKGFRRLRIARELRMRQVPAIVLAAPAGQSADDYARQLRFVLTEARQDLVPTQKADLIVQLRERFSMNNRQVAAYLGIVPDSVTNWLAARGYIEPVRQALDSGALTMQRARVFDGLTESGQAELWKRHGEELRQPGGGKVHKRLRAQYPPSEFPAFYGDPGLVTARLERKTGKRKATVRNGLSTSEKKNLLESFEFQEAELRLAADELRAMKGEISAAAPIIGCIVRNEKLLALVPDEMIEELARFAEVYVG